MDLNTVAEELYGLLPDEFTGARNELARQARESGDRDLAKAIGQLRRPTTSAWLANLLVRQRRERIDELLELGGALRAAQQQLAADQLRELSRQRQQVVSALAREGRRLAAAAGSPAGDQVERELEGTLEAALRDPAAAGALASGQLTRALSYAGLGPVDIGGAVAAPPDRASRPDQQRPARSRTKGSRSAEAQRRAETAAAEEELRAIQQAADDANQEATAQQSRVSDSTQRRDAIRGQIADIERHLAQLHAEEGKAAKNVLDAQHARDAAARSARGEQRRLEQAQAKLDRLRG